MNVIRIFASISLLLVFNSSCFAGWVISEETVDNYGNKSMQTTFIQQNRIRYENSSSVTILDLNDSSITIVFPTMMVYWKGTPNELNVETLETFDIQVQSIIAGLPTNEQAGFQQLYDSVKMKLQQTEPIVRSEKLKLINTDSMVYVAPYSTCEYTLQKDSTIKKKFWVTGAINPYKEIDIQLFIALNNEINPYSRRGISLQTEEYLRLLSSGMIVKSRIFSESGAFLETAVVNSREVRIPDDFFSPPVNYRRVTLSEAFTLPMIDSELFGSQ